MNQLNYNSKGSENFATDNSVFVSNDTQIPEMNTIFCYNGNNVTMRVINGIVFVNLTEFAKPFPDKNLSQIINSKEITSYVTRLSEIRNYSSLDLLQVRKGNYADGAEQGTWAHQKIAIRVAQKLSTDFAIWVDDRIEELLKYGMTATQPTLEQMLSNPDLVISLATQLKTERAEKNRIQSELIEQKVLIEQKEEEISMKDERLTVLTPKGETYDKIMSSQGLVTTNMIAAFLGMSAAKLNKLLCEWGVQYKQSSTYFLVSKYIGKGLAKHIPYPYMDNGVQKSKEHMYWTEVGRKFVIDLYNSKVAA